MKRDIKKQLAELGIDGNGIIENPIKIEVYERLTGFSFENGQENEFDSVDYKHTLLDKYDDDFQICLEVKNGFITHSYFN